MIFLVPTTSPTIKAISKNGKVRDVILGQTEAVDFIFEVINDRRPSLPPHPAKGLVSLGAFGDQSKTSPF